MGFQYDFIYVFVDEKIKCSRSSIKHGVSKIVEQNVAVPREKCYAAKSQQPLLHNSLRDRDGCATLHYQERDGKTVTEVV